MGISRTNLLSLALVIASFAMTAALYSRLPQWVPTHWNARGVADGFMPKPWGPFVSPLVMAGVYLLPWISPRGYRVEKFQSVFEIIQTTVLAFLFLVTVLVLFAGIGVAVPMDRAIYVGMGLLFIVLGNFMGKFTKTFSSAYGPHGRWPAMKSGSGRIASLASCSFSPALVYSFPLS